MVGSYSVVLRTSSVHGQSGEKEFLAKTQRSAQRARKRITSRFDHPSHPLSVNPARGCSRPAQGCRTRLPWGGTVLFPNPTGLWLPSPNRSSAINQLPPRFSRSIQQTWFHSTGGVPFSSKNRHEMIEPEISSDSTPLGLAPITRLCPRVAEYSNPGLEDTTPVGVNQEWNQNGKLFVYPS